MTNSHPRARAILALNMRIQSLRVVHFPKGPGQPELPPRAAGVFELDTCQRRVWVFPQGALPAGVADYRGETAYRFLLRVATGLESEIRGETDIFGQLKDAWRAYQSSPEAAFVRELQPWMQRLFEDTKDIRAQYLQNLGGSSYGSLTRLLLRQRRAAAGEPLLIVGAGHIARSIAPWLLEHELWLWNRSATGLAALKAELTGRPGVRLRVVDDEARAWREAAHVVVCIPQGEDDARRIALWREGAAAGHRKASIIHLGTQRETSGAWGELGEFHALDDLFTLQQAQNELRADQFARADRACDGARPPAQPRRLHHARARLGRSGRVRVSRPPFLARPGLTVYP